MSGRMAKTKGLWTNIDFLKFWFGETLAMFGSRVTGLALPLVAALTLNSTPWEMGVLNALQFSPYLLVGLFAGVYIDRLRRKPIMLAANIGRAVLLLVIPFGYIFHFLEMYHLYVIGFLVGTLTLLFDLSYQSYLPSLVGKEHLTEGNSKLEVSRSLADVSGPGISGGLIALMSAPIVLILHSFTLLCSAFSLLLIKKDEPSQAKVVAHKPIFQEIGKGMRLVFGNKYLRAIAGEASTYNMFSQVMAAVSIIYITKQLQITPALLGIILSTASIGSIIGSLIAKRLGDKYSLGSIIIVTMMLGCGAPLLVPLASGPLHVTVPILIISYFFGSMGVVISNIYVVSIRQTITPDDMLGKMNASYRFVVTGVTPIGALLGGALGNLVGLRMTLLIGALGTLTALIWVLCSPLVSLKKMPEETDANLPLNPNAKKAMVE
ncbi:MFS transporter [Paenibacillus campi]|uniref:MFS transporter n=1 Tax=Paenibacillus campi TaxID=3106031 RepID=UPI002AFEB02D|nr:MFS transporter [Paenibacillus sp. SGZ-1014]